jgi:hypothetical protein
MTQRSADGGHNIRSPWLGVKGGWRWAFNATFVEWTIGLVSVPLLLLAFWLVVPVGFAFLVAAWWFGRWASGRMTLAMLSRVTFSAPERARPRARILFAVLGLAMAALALPNLAVWVFPAPIWVATPLTLGVAFFGVRAVRHLIDSNRPVTYWATVLLRRRAKSRKPMALSFGALTPDRIIPVEPSELVVVDQDPRPVRPRRRSGIEWLADVLLTKEIFEEDRDVRP